MDKKSNISGEGSPSMSRFGRAHKPKISSDFCDIDTLFKHRDKIKPSSSSNANPIPTLKIKSMIKLDAAAASNFGINKISVPRQVKITKPRTVVNPTQLIDFEEKIQETKVLKIFIDKDENKKTEVVKKKMDITFSKKKVTDLNKKLRDSLFLHPVKKPTLVPASKTPRGTFIKKYITKKPNLCKPKFNDDVIELDDDSNWSPPTKSSTPKYKNKFVIQSNEIITPARKAPKIKILEDIIVKTPRASLSLDEPSMSQEVVLAGKEGEEQEVFSVGYMNNEGILVDESGNIIEELIYDPMKDNILETQTQGLNLDSDSMCSTISTDFSPGNIISYPVDFIGAETVVSSESYSDIVDEETFEGTEETVFTTAMENQLCTDGDDSQVLILINKEDDLNAINEGDIVGTSKGNIDNLEEATYDLQIDQPEGGEMIVLDGNIANQLGDSFIILEDLDGKDEDGHITILNSELNDNLEEGTQYILRCTTSDGVQEIIINNESQVVQHADDVLAVKEEIVQSTSEEVAVESQEQISSLQEVSQALKENISKDEKEIKKANDLSEEEENKTSLKRNQEEKEKVKINAENAILATPETSGRKMEEVKSAEKRGKQMEKIKSPESRGIKKEDIKSRDRRSRKSEDNKSDVSKGGKTEGNRSSERKVQEQKTELTKSSEKEVKTDERSRRKMEQTGSSKKLEVDKSAERKSTKVEEIKEPKDATQDSTDTRHTGEIKSPAVVRIPTKEEELYILKTYGRKLPGKIKVDKPIMEDKNNKDKTQRKAKETSEEENVIQEFKEGETESVAKNEETTSSLSKKTTKEFLEVLEQEINESPNKPLTISSMDTDEISSISPESSTSKTKSPTKHLLKDESHKSSDDTTKTNINKSSEALCAKMEKTIEANMREQDSIALPVVRKSSRFSRGDAEIIESELPPEKSISSEKSGRLEVSPEKRSSKREDSSDKLGSRKVSPDKYKKEEKSQNKTHSEKLGKSAKQDEKRKIGETKKDTSKHDKSSSSGKSEHSKSEKKDSSRRRSSEVKSEKREDSSKRRSLSGDKTERRKDSHGLENKPEKTKENPDKRHTKSSKSEEKRKKSLGRSENIKSDRKLEDSIQNTASSEIHKKPEDSKSEKTLIEPVSVQQEQRLSKQEDLQQKHKSTSKEIKSESSDIPEKDISLENLDKTASKEKAASEKRKSLRHSNVEDEKLKSPLQKKNESLSKTIKDSQQQEVEATKMNITKSEESVVTKEVVSPVENETVAGIPAIVVEANKELDAKNTPKDDKVEGSKVIDEDFGMYSLESENSEKPYYFSSDKKTYSRKSRKSYTEKTLTPTAEKNIKPTTDEENKVKDESKEKIVQSKSDVRTPKKASAEKIEEKDIEQTKQRENRVDKDVDKDIDQQTIKTVHSPKTRRSKSKSRSSLLSPKTQDSSKNTQDTEEIKIDKNKTEEGKSIKKTEQVTPKVNNQKEMSKELKRTSLLSPKAADSKNKSEQLKAQNINEEKSNILDSTSESESLKSEAKKSLEVATLNKNDKSETSDIKTVSEKKTEGKVEIVTGKSKLHKEDDTSETSDIKTVSEKKTKAETIGEVEIVTGKSKLHKEDGKDKKLKESNKRSKETEVKEKRKSSRITQIQTDSKAKVIGEEEINVSITEANSKITKLLIPTTEEVKKAAEEKPRSTIMETAASKKAYFTVPNEVEIPKTLEMETAASKHDKTTECEDTEQLEKSASTEENITAEKTSPVKEFFSPKNNKELKKLLDRNLGEVFTEGRKTRSGRDLHQNSISTENIAETHENSEVKDRRRSRSVSIPSKDEDKTVSKKTKATLKHLDAGNIEYDDKKKSRSSLKKNEDKNITASEDNTQKKMDEENIETSKDTKNVKDNLMINEDNGDDKKDMPSSKILDESSGLEKNIEEKSNKGEQKDSDCTKSRKEHKHTKKENSSEYRHKRKSISSAKNDERVDKVGNEIGTEVVAKAIKEEITKEAKDAQTFKVISSKDEKVEKGLKMVIKKTTRSSVKQEVIADESKVKQIVDTKKVDEEISTKEDDWLTDDIWENKRKTRSRDNETLVKPTIKSGKNVDKDIMPKKITSKHDHTEVNKQSIKHDTTSDYETFDDSHIEKIIEDAFNTPVEDISKSKDKKLKKSEQRRSTRLKQTNEDEPSIEKQEKPEEQLKEKDIKTSQQVKQTKRKTVKATNNDESDKEEFEYYQELVARLKLKETKVVLKDFEQEILPSKSTRTNNEEQSEESEDSDEEILDKESPKKKVDEKQVKHKTKEKLISTRSKLKEENIDDIESRNIEKPEQSGKTNIPVTKLVKGKGVKRKLSEISKTKDDWEISSRLTSESDKEIKISTSQSDDDTPLSLRIRKIKSSINDDDDSKPKLQLNKISPLSASTEFSSPSSGGSERKLVVRLKNIVDLMKPDLQDKLKKSAMKNVKSPQSKKQKLEEDNEDVHEKRRSQRVSELKPVCYKEGSKIPSETSPVKPPPVFKKNSLKDIMDDVEIIKRALLDSTKNNEEPEPASSFSNEVDEILSKDVSVMNEEKFSMNIADNITGTDDESSTGVDTETICDESFKDTDEDSITCADENVGNKEYSSVAVKKEVNSDEESQTCDINETVVEVKKEIKEETLEVMENQRFRELYDFNDGDLAYAKLGSYPYWPCMIAREPKTDIIMNFKMNKLMYHVRFFGDKGRRSWVKQENLIPLTSKNDLEKAYNAAKAKGVPSKYYMQFKLNLGKLNKMWNIGLEEALNLLRKTVDQRYEFFFEMFASEKEKRSKAKEMKIKSERIDEELENLEEVEHTVKRARNSSSPTKSIINEKETKWNKQKRKRKRYNDADYEPSSENTSADETEGIRPKKKKVKKYAEEREIKEEILDDVTQSGMSTPEINFKRDLCQLDLSSEGSLSDTDSSSRWSVRTPIVCTNETQSALYKRNSLFKRVSKDKVCQKCLKPGEIYKCRGKCYSYYHKECSLMKMKVEVVDEEYDSDCQIVTITHRRYQPPKNLSLSTDKQFREMTLSEQIDFKLKELMDPILLRASYETASDASSEDSASERGSELTIQHVSGEDVVLVNKSKKKKRKYEEDFKCTKCVSSFNPACFVCGKEQNPIPGGSVRQKCSIQGCGKFYHLECLKVWPQTQISLHSTSAGLDAFSCPMHMCHICVSDNPRASLSRLSMMKIVRCLKCPATYHSNTCCIPAGTEILSTTQIICPRHSEAKSGRHDIINTKWCFICSEGGDLICCETCPTSVHIECSQLNLKADETFICEECETGRLPLYDEIVWVKLGKYRWWPALILFPNEVPENIKTIPHQHGDFVVKFFGTHDHYWVNRGRVFLFQEGDEGPGGNKNKMDLIFKKAIEEAAEAHAFKSEFKKTMGESMKMSDKPPPYIRLKVNKPVGNVKQFDGNISNTTPCNCDPNSENPCGPDSYCINRLLMTECDPEVCPARNKCQNQKFEKREYPPLTPYQTEGRGWGLKTLAPIKKGQFVIEYVGEVIDDQEYQRRIAKMHEQKDDNYYFLTIENNRMIDAGPKGNFARFMNHCCEPNCETQKWTIKGETRVGLFAKEDIEANTEVTFNYNLESAGEEKKVCMCGAQSCSGFIGVKVKNANDEKKVKKSTKKKRSPTPVTPVVNMEPCFVCGGDGDTFPCHNKICTKYYHLKCVDLDTKPDGKWSCPWHNCNVCSKRTIRCCVKCPNSYCPVHSEGNVRHDKLLGFICTDHDPSKEPQEILSVVKKTRKAAIVTEESDVTSTTPEEIEESPEEISNTSQGKLKYNLSESFEHAESDSKDKKKRGRPRKHQHSPNKQIKIEPQKNLNIVPNILTPEIILTSSVPERHLRTNRKVSSEDSENEKLLKRQQAYEKALPMRKRTTPRTESTEN